MRDKIAPIAIALAAAVLGTFAMLGLDEIDVSAPKTPVAEATHYWEDEQTETDSIDWCMAYDLPSGSRPTRSQPRDGTPAHLTGLWF